MTFLPSTVSAPSSTRTPLGSVTVTELPTPKSATFVVIVTALGGEVSEEPLIGEVLTSELAFAGNVIKREKRAIAQAAITLRTFTVLSQI